jgi:hypothetical protein
LHPTSLVPLATFPHAPAPSQSWHIPHAGVPSSPDGRKFVLQVPDPLHVCAAEMHEPAAELHPTSFTPFATLEHAPAPSQSWHTGHAGVPSAPLGRKFVLHTPKPLHVCAAV